MRATEIAVTCPCEKGQLFKTSLTNEQGQPVMFVLGEDERIYFRGYCNHCGGIVTFSASLLTLIFDCPKVRPTQ
jgi:hypothetical protein